MNLDEALALLRRSEERFADNDPDPLWDNPPWYDGYVNSSPEEQARLRDAAESLATAGDRRYPYAWELLRSAVIEPDRLGRLLHFYLDRRLDDGSKVSSLLGGLYDRLGAADQDRLQRVFVARPDRHLSVGVGVLKHRPVGEAWDALAAYTLACNDPAELAKIGRRLWDVDDSLVILPRRDGRRLAYRRVCAFYELVRGKSKSVLELTASHVTLNHEEFCARVGLIKGTELTSEGSGNPVCHTCQRSPR
ncbi:hypothetical protein O7626_25280 [Micromonospora sp. WMMD1102]|uniref:hypothetical protein n=1 Tax=Micromonospora sp. WMMD1102 TaxID=3016105 RepID=UPI0024156AA8|nr:hypothetical protein [Micromonospora sp. WMMD1102]MDG4789203.1 hypothetical protein [Micromonospora sp. WMMD1102]